MTSPRSLLTDYTHFFQLLPLHLLLEELIARNKGDVHCYNGKLIFFDR